MEPRALDGLIQMVLRWIENEHQVGFGSQEPFSGIASACIKCGLEPVNTGRIVPGQFFSGFTTVVEHHVKKQTGSQNIVFSTEGCCFELQGQWYLLRAEDAPEAVPGNLLRPIECLLLSGEEPVWVELERDDAMGLLQY